MVCVYLINYSFGKSRTEQKFQRVSPFMKYKMKYNLLTLDPSLVLPALPTPGGPINPLSPRIPLRPFCPGSPCKYYVNAKFKRSNLNKFVITG